MTDYTALLERAEGRFPRPHHADDGLMVKELCAAIRALAEERDRLRALVNDMATQMGTGYSLAPIGRWRKRIKDALQEKPQ